MLNPIAIVQLIWQDETGSNAVTQLSASSALEVSEIAADAEAFAAISAPLTGCALVGIRIRYRSAFEPLDLPVISTPITKVGQFYFSTPDDNPDGYVSVPAIKDSILVTTGPTAGFAIDIAHSDVIAFTDAVIDNGISNPFGDDFVSVVSAYLQSRV